MKLFYFEDPDGNFGDDMNTWIWDELMPGWRAWRDDTTLIGIGTILNTQLALPQGRKLVVGSGTGYGSVPQLTPPEMWDVRAVRGPLSAERLGLPKERGVVDPAMMLPSLAMFKDTQKTGTVPILIPHCSNSERHDWVKVCQTAGLRYVSPRGEAKAVVNEIAAAPLVLAESMHAAIVADAFRTPWIAVSISGILNRPKWLDWADSLDIDLTVHELFPEFSAAISKFRKLKAALKGGAAKPAASGGPSPAQAMPPRADGLKSSRKALRRGLETLGIASRLKRASTLAPTLSDAAKLADRQAAFAGVLQKIRDDYGQ